MSHVTEIEVIIDDLESLDKACKRLGDVELVRDQKTYKWYGASVGDTKLPSDRNVEDLGTCDHAVRLTSPKGPRGSQSYEVGVYKFKAGTMRNGKNVGGKYGLEWDTWLGGYGLTDAVGEDCGKLRQAYATERTLKVARQKYTGVQERVMADGSIQITCRPRR